MLPTCGSAFPCAAICSTPATPARAPASTKLSITTRLTRMPVRRAAAGSTRPPAGTVRTGSDAGRTTSRPRRAASARTAPARWRPRDAQPGEHRAEPTADRYAAGVGDDGPWMTIVTPRVQMIALHRMLERLHRSQSGRRRSRAPYRPPPRSGPRPARHTADRCTGRRAPRPRRRSPPSSPGWQMRRPPRPVRSHRVRRCCSRPSASASTWLRPCPFAPPVTSAFLPSSPRSTDIGVLPHWWYAGPPGRSRRVDRRRGVPIAALRLRARRMDRPRLGSESLSDRRTVTP